MSNFEKTLEALKVIETIEKESFNAFDYSRAYLKLTKQPLDWHKGSDILAGLEMINLLDHAGISHDGMTLYKIK